MLEGFPCQQQEPGSKSCLPTAIRAIFLAYGRSVTQAELSEWCQETPAGCWIDLALDNLRDDADVEELAAEDEIWERVDDRADPVPVLVTIEDPFGASQVDHAVVIVGLESTRSGNGAKAVVFFCDPLTGQIEQDDYNSFRLKWDSAGRRAFVIYPG